MNVKQRHRPAEIAFPRFPQLPHPDCALRDSPRVRPCSGRRMRSPRETGTELKPALSGKITGNPQGWSGRIGQAVGTWIDPCIRRALPLGCAATSRHGKRRQIGAGRPGPRDQGSGTEVAGGGMDARARLLRERDARRRSGRPGDQQRGQRGALGLPFAEQAAAAGRSGTGSSSPMMSEQSAGPVTERIGAERCFRAEDVPGLAAGRRQRRHG